MYRNKGQWPLSTASFCWLMPLRRSRPWLMQWLYAMMIDGPSYSSASLKARTVCTRLAPKATLATYTLPYAMAIMPRSFLPRGLPPAANFAIAPTGVDLDIWPPVFE